MPTPYIELPRVDELFNGQQDNSALQSDEDLDLTHEYDLTEEFAGRHGSSMYIVNGGVYENLTANNTPVLVTTYDALIELELDEGWIAANAPTSFLGVKWTLEKEGGIQKWGNTSNEKGMEEIFLAAKGRSGLTLSDMTWDVDVQRQLSIKAFPYIKGSTYKNDSGVYVTDDDYYNDTLPAFEFIVIPFYETGDDTGGPILVPNYSPFVANITAVENNRITINQSWNSFKEKLGEVKEEVLLPSSLFPEWTISHKIIELQ